MRKVDAGTQAGLCDQGWGLLRVGGSCMCIHVEGKVTHLLDVLCVFSILLPQLHLVQVF